MKRFMTMALLCTLVLGFASLASAADIKVSGDYTFEGYWADNMDFMDDSAEQDFNVLQRLRTKFEFIANENLKGVLYTEAGTSTWGMDETQIGASDAVIEMKQGYIDFNWPGTSVNTRIGYQGVALPSAVGLNGSMILNEEVASVTVGGAFTENVSYLAGYGRASQSDENEQQIDVYFAALPIAFDNITVTPFAAYGNVGDNFVSAADKSAALPMIGFASNGDVDNGWWAGLAFDASFMESFLVKADFNYGQVDGDKDFNDRSGWLADVSLAYTGWKQYVTPELFFVYTSGEDDDDLSSERMPLIAPDWAVSSFYTGGNWGLSGVAGDINNLLGFWTLGLALKDISFLEDLSHTFRVLYYQGTNDKAIAAFDGANGVSYGQTLTEDDNLWEVNFDSQYKIYDALTGYVELGWLNADLDKDVWGAGRDGGDAYKLSVGLNYSF